MTVKIKTTVGADKIEVYLPSSFQKIIELNEKNYRFGNSSRQAKLVKSNSIEM